MLPLLAGLCFSLSQPEAEGRGVETISEVLDLLLSPLPS